MLNITNYQRNAQNYGEVSPHMSHQSEWKSSQNLQTINVGEGAAAKSLQSCPTLCDPMDCSLPGFYVRGIFQARVLEWGTRRRAQGRVDIIVQFVKKCNISKCSEKHNKTRRVLCSVVSNSLYPHGL